MEERGWPALAARSAARDREEYLRRPDLGRLLQESSIADIKALPKTGGLVFIVADGLSALAIHRHAIPFLEAVFQTIGSGPTNPVVVARQARVALGDHIGALLETELAIVLIGERPGLSAPDSMGVYLTWNPQPGRRDAERNCISNIQLQGLAYDVAAHKLAFLINEARRRKLSGVALKEMAGNLLD
jgi:ethanolamine ammonia-lyase small subunit